jgi:hypothetical protein
MWEHIAHLRKLADVFMNQMMQVLTTSILELSNVVLFDPVVRALSHEIHSLLVVPLQDS